MRDRPRTLVAIAVGLIHGCLGVPWDAQAQSAENVAIVINENSAASQKIGTYYTQKRALPASNVIRIRTATEDVVDRGIFVGTIQQPIAAAIASRGLQDRLLYLVLTKGVPLKIAGTSGPEGTTASVDSELTLLYRRMTGENVPVLGRIDNPYFLGTHEIGEAQRFSHREHDIYLVTRLDGFTVEQALGIVDKSLAPTTTGRIVLDQREALINRAAEDWLEQAARRLAAQGQEDRVLLERTLEPARDIRPVLGYYSWGSNDPRNRARSVNMGFVPGSIAATFVSSDARTFREPPSNWVPSDDWNNRSTWFAGSPQSLIGDLIREGATGVAGNVSEPYIQSTVRPQILFSAYLSGFNLVESFYLAVPHLSWQTVVIGDPLCAPFPRKPLARTDIEENVDPDTMLPDMFAKRRLTNVGPQFRGMPDRAVVLAVRGEALFSRGDAAGARDALEESTRLAPSIASTQLLLALIYDQIAEYDAAISRYRHALELQPTYWRTDDGQVTEAIALNNLAYALGVHRNAPADALPFARRAVDHAPQNWMFLDTLGWIQHLAGDNLSAAKTFDEALRNGPTDPEIRLHASIVYAASGAVGAAEQQLKEALRLDPEFEKRPEVRELRTRLKTLSP